MKKTDLQGLRKKSAKELLKEISVLHLDIAKESLEDKLQERKDTNIISKKKKMLAILKTVLREQTLSTSV